MFSADQVALLLMDYQAANMDQLSEYEGRPIRRNVVALVKSARILSVPVIVTSCQEDQLPGPIMPELREALVDGCAARIVRAGLVNVWDEPDFRAAVLATRRRQLVMAGISTGILRFTLPSRRFAAVIKCRR
jgi:nicotinamidase-related amidase